MRRPNDAGPGPRLLGRALSCACLLVLACSGDAPPSTDGVGAAVPAPPPRRQRPSSDIYDEHGIPRESDQRVAGLVLPRGLTKLDAISRPRRHVYASNVEMNKLLRYFGPRLHTMNIEQRGSIVVYREATVRDARGGVVELDVTIQPSSSHAARVEIYERPPPPPAGTVISEEEIRRHLKTLTKNRE